MDAPQTHSPVGTTEKLVTPPFTEKAQGSWGDFQQCSGSVTPISLENEPSQLSYVHIIDDQNPKTQGKTKPSIACKSLNDVPA